MPFNILVLSTLATVFTAGILFELLLRKSTVYTLTEAWANCLAVAFSWPPVTANRSGAISAMPVRADAPGS